MSWIDASSLSQRVEQTIDGRHPARSVLRLLDLQRGRVLAAVGLFAMKETPLWFLPVVTGAIIDIVADGGPSRRCRLARGRHRAAAQNYPNHILYTRNFMRVVRDTGAGLRNALAARLQTLSIGYHTRASSSVMQTKVVRDVENVELMLQQVDASAAVGGHGADGAIVMTASACRSSCPSTRSRSLRRAAAWGHRPALPRAQRGVPARGGGLRGRVGEMATLIPDHAGARPRADGGDRVADGAEERARAPACTSTCSTATSRRSRGSSMQLLGVGCLGSRRCSPSTGLVPITPGEVVLLSSYFALLTGSVTKLLMLMPVERAGNWSRSARSRRCCRSPTSS